MTAPTRASASTEPVSAVRASWGRTARSCSVPTTAARRESARTASAFARRATQEMTAHPVSSLSGKLCSNSFYSMDTTGGQ